MSQAKEWRVLKHDGWRRGQGRLIEPDPHITILPSGKAYLNKAAKIKYELCAGMKVSVAFIDDDEEWEGNFILVNVGNGIDDFDLPIRLVYFNYGGMPVITIGGLWREYGIDLSRSYKYPLNDGGDFFSFGPVAMQEGERT